MLHKLGEPSVTYNQMIVCECEVFAGSLIHDMFGGSELGREGGERGGREGAHIVVACTSVQLVVICSTATMSYCMCPIYT